MYVCMYVYVYMDDKSVDIVCIYWVNGNKFMYACMHN